MRIETLAESEVGILMYWRVFKSTSKKQSQIGIFYAVVCSSEIEKLCAKEFNISDILMMGATLVKKWNKILRIFHYHDKATYFY